MHNNVFQGTAELVMIAYLVNDRAQRISKK